MTMNNLFKIFCWLLVNFLVQNKCFAQMNLCFCENIPAKDCSFFHFSTIIANTPCVTDPLVLAFEDNFEGNTINLDNWIPNDEFTAFPHNAVPRDQFFTKGSKQWYLKENIVVEDGKLKIVAKRENLTNKTFSIWDGDANGGQGGMVSIGPNDFNFTSGEVDTKWEFGYGVYEIMCKLPSAGKGWYPAFWAYSDASGSCDEIDVFEFWSAANRDNDYKLLDFTATNHAKWAGNHVQCASKIRPAIDFTQGFHKFSLHFLPHVVRWYVDDWLVKEVYKNYKITTGGTLTPLNCGSYSNVAEYVRDKQFPFGPMNIKINFAIEYGSDTHGDKSPDSNTPFPNSFEIEYIIIYQFTPCQGVININSQSELDALLNTQENYYNVIFGTTINIDNCTLKNKRALRLMASEEINFGTNFITETGSYLESSLGECQSTSFYKQNISDNKENSSNLNCKDLVSGEMVKNDGVLGGSKTNIESSNLNTIGINPNPLNLKNDLLNLKLFLNDISEISILSSNGQIILDKLKISESAFQIKSEVFKTSGMYYVSIKGLRTDKTLYFKLIVI